MCLLNLALLILMANGMTKKPCSVGAAACARAGGVGGAQDKAGDDEALGFVGLLGQVGVVGAHVAGGGGGSAAAGAQARARGQRKEPSTQRRRGVMCSRKQVVHGAPDKGAGLMCCSRKRAFH